MQAAHLLRAYRPEWGARILAALSGGADSVALLAALCEKFGAEALAAAHVNHCLRGAESDRDEAFCRELCRGLGVPFTAARRDVRAEARRGESIEDAARRIRYEELVRAARAGGFAFVATAHNANDNAETVLLNLIRGAGTAGVAGIPPERRLAEGVTVIRPLLAATRAEILAFLDERGLPHVEDSTNASTDYTRNFIRREVLPRLAAANSAAVEHICAAAESARADEEHLAREAAALADAASLPCGNGAVALSTAAVLDAPRPVALRALRLAHTRAGGGALGRTHTEALYSLCLSQDPSAALDLPHGFTARRVYDALVFSRGDGARQYSVAFRETVAQRMQRGGGFDPSRAVFLRADRRYSVRTRAEGDVFRAAGRGVTKSVKKLMIELKIPARERDGFPLVVDEDGAVAAVPGHAAAEGFAASAGEDAVEVRLRAAEDSLSAGGSCGEQADGIF